MTELEELEDIVGSLEYIEPFGIEPDFSSLGLEPPEVLGFHTEEEMEKAIKLLTMDVKNRRFLFTEILNNTFLKYIINIKTIKLN